jgi:hypothetical protein
MTLLHTKYCTSFHRNRLLCLRVFSLVGRGVRPHRHARGPQGEVVPHVDVDVSNLLLHELFQGAGTGGPGCLPLPLSPEQGQRLALPRPACGLREREDLTLELICYGVERLK